MCSDDLCNDSKECGVPAAVLAGRAICWFVSFIVWTEDIGKIALRQLERVRGGEREKQRAAICMIIRCLLEAVRYIRGILYVHEIDLAWFLLLRGFWFALSSRKVLLHLDQTLLRNLLGTCSLEKIVLGLDIEPEEPSSLQELLLHYLLLLLLRLYGHKMWLLSCL